MKENIINALLRGGDAQQHLGNRFYDRTQTFFSECCNQVRFQRPIDNRLQRFHRNWVADFAVNLFLHSYTMGYS